MHCSDVRVVNEFERRCSICPANFLLELAFSSPFNVIPTCLRAFFHSPLYPPKSRISENVGEVDGTKLDGVLEAVRPRRSVRHLVCRRCGEWRRWPYRARTCVRVAGKIARSAVGRRPFSSARQDFRRRLLSSVLFSNGGLLLLQAVLMNVEATLARKMAMAALPFLGPCAARRPLVASLC